MSFVSVAFLVFLAISVTIYYLIPKRFRWIVLLAASYVFYLWGGLKTIVFLLFTTVTCWIAGILLERLNQKRKTLSKEQQEPIRRKKKIVTAAALIVNFGMLYVLKYLNFTLTAASSVFARLGIAWTPKQLTLVLPLGVSFYIFQTVGYVIDQYRGKYPAQHHLARFALFTSFFPQMVQGPISRYHELAPQLYEGSEFQAENLRNGIQRMLWGYLKKMVIADRASVLISTFFANSDAYGGAVTAFTIIMYCINLYCDFSGGIDITIGAAELFGIRMAENFRRPLFATSLSEYWRRWHITLGTWMRDYVFYPISLSKPFGKLNKWARHHINGKLGKIIATSLATFIIYLIIGIWHGANFRYIAYGFWNGAIITASLLLSNTFYRWREALHIHAESSGWKLFGMIRTAFLVFIGRYITRSPRLLTAISLIGRTFNPRTVHLHELWNGTVLQMGLTGGDLAIILFSTLGMILVEVYQERNGSVREALAKKSAFVQWLAMLIPMALLLFLGLMRGNYIASEFIYRQY